MSDEENTPDEPQNPFAGTPLEQIFGAFAGGQVDLSGLMGQIQNMFTPHDGAINFEMATDVARHTLATAGPDPSPNANQQNAVDDAARLAEMWLDTVTDLPQGATSAVAWSKAEWIEATGPTWKTLVEPIAANVVSAMGSAMPDEIKATAGPLLGMLGQAGGAMFGQQTGQALGALAGEVISSTDIGLPLGPERMAAVLPANVATFGDGLDQRESDVLLYVMLRECAHHRLFHHAAWLRPAIVNAVEEYGNGTTIDLSSIESSLQGLDPTRPEDLANALEGGLFEPAQSPEQKAALARLETLLAFVEGWVDEVVTQATVDRMPAAAALSEATRRRRAAGGPAEATFANLVGLELRPRRLREAATLWSALRDRQGAAARDAVWSHPDLMPGATDLDDPLGFAQGEHSSPDDDDAFNAALNDLLNEDDGE